jgi:hypothetical protein
MTLCTHGARVYTRACINSYNINTYDITTSLTSLISTYTMFRYDSTAVWYEMWKWVCLCTCKWVLACVGVVCCLIVGTWCLFPSTSRHWSGVTCMHIHPLLPSRSPVLFHLWIHLTTFLSVLHFRPLYSCFILRTRRQFCLCSSAGYSASFPNGFYLSCTLFFFRVSFFLFFLFVNLLVRAPLPFVIFVACTFHMPALSVQIEWE